MFAAHSGQDELHPLDAHLRAVGVLAARFAEHFCSSDWARLAGYWHDLGKYRSGFQQYIRQTQDPDAHIEGHVSGREKTHSTAGALYAVQKLGSAAGGALAFLIAGHHTGLQDRHQADGGPASLQARLASPDSRREFDEALREPIPVDLLAADSPKLDGVALADFALWLRMLFSCLVDADFLDTEAYFDPEKAARRGKHPSLEDLRTSLDRHMAQFASHADSDVCSKVNAKRSQVLNACRATAATAPGFFTLTVPTGGGKTLSSLAFALNHAIEHGKRRIVYAIPFTSIIEQNAQVFRDALGVDAVLEHHSNLDVDERKEDHANRLAAENWDAPLIVTTNVQLFESLHAARTSQCRKLHNLAESVIVLDEAQMLPRDFLAPVLRTLKSLVAHYGVTVLLCTATQPMLSSRVEPVTRRINFDGLDNAREIIDDPGELFDALRRVDVHLPADFAVSQPWNEIAGELRRHDSVLAIVNTRRDARDLFDALGDASAVHLSALMCAAHRSATIAKIRKGLARRHDGLSAPPVRVVSTQLVEAGVDLDFPVVYRALAGLDSIAQAAGRCNREGKLDRMGQVHVFVPPQRAPPGLLRQGEEITRELAMVGELHDPLAPATFRRYFDHLYGKGNLDAQDIVALLKPERAAFRTAAQRFRLIDEHSEAVIVPYSPDGHNEESPVHDWLAALEKDGNAKWARRKLQRYVVNVPRRQLDRSIERRDIEERAGLWLALNSRYDPAFGLLLPEDHGNPTYYVG